MAERAVCLYWAEMCREGPFSHLSFYFWPFELELYIFLSAYLDNNTWHNRNTFYHPTLLLSYAIAKTNVENRIWFSVLRIKLYLWSFNKGSSKLSFWFFVPSGIVILFCLAIEFHRIWKWWFVFKVLTRNIPSIRPFSSIKWYRRWSWSNKAGTTTANCFILFIFAFSSLKFWHNSAYNDWKMRKLNHGFIIYGL